MELNNITTEKRNDKSRNIDEVSTLEMLKIINEEDKTVAFAVEKILPEIAKAVEIIAEKLKNGGRLFYIGAGTSGRLGILDASECPPTFGVDFELVQGIIAGGSGAVFKAVEGAEDNLTQGETDLCERKFSSKDVLVGIAASGRTPYVIGALKYAKSIGATAISLACSKNPAMADFADISLNPITGAEIITGSTRMKAGTAEKLVLNMISTGTMINSGKVYGNLMVDVQAINEKLKARAINIVAEVTGVSENEAVEALRNADGNAKLAIFLLLTGLSKIEGKRTLKEHGGNLRKALGAIK